MPGKPIPSWPSEKPFDGLPTLDTLLQQSGGVKVAKLRLLLRGVSRWKCKDNSVRYDPIAAAAALEPQWEDDDDDDAAANDNANGAANDNAALPADPALATAMIFQRATLQALQTLQRTLTLQNDVIKAMGEPMRQGMQLVTDAQGVLLKRCEKSDASWERMVTLTEDLQSTQAERDLAKQRAAHRLTMQLDAFATAKQYFPDLLAKFALTMEANYAVDLARSIDPAHLEAFLDLGVLPEDKREMGRKLLEMMKARRKSAPVDTEGSNAKPEPTATAAAEPAATAAAPAAQPATAAPDQEVPHATSASNGAVPAPP